MTDPQHDAMKEILLKTIEAATNKLDLFVVGLAVAGAQYRGFTFDQNELQEFQTKSNVKAKKIAVAREREDVLIGGMNP